MLLIVTGNRRDVLEGNHFISLLALYLNFNHLGFDRLSYLFFLLLLRVG